MYKRQAVKAAIALTQNEGILPALETAHALAALDKMSIRPNEVIVLNLSGRGDKDMLNYEKYVG